MAFEKGTLIFANYTARVKDTGEGIESTLEDEAKKLKIYEESRKYEPRLVAVGEGWLISGLDAEVAKLVRRGQEGDRAPAGEGVRRERPHPAPHDPASGSSARGSTSSPWETRSTSTTASGSVRFIGSGRAQVDFNHRLAGKSIIYDFEVLSTGGHRRRQVEGARRPEARRGGGQGYLQLRGRRHSQ